MREILFDYSLANKVSSHSTDMAFFDIEMPEQFIHSAN